MGVIVVVVVVVENVFLSIGIVREVLLGSFVTKQSNQEVSRRMFSALLFLSLWHFLSEHVTTVLTLMNRPGPGKPCLLTVSYDVGSPGEILIELFI